MGGGTSEPSGSMLDPSRARFVQNNGRTRAARPEGKRYGLG